MSKEGRKLCYIKIIKAYNIHFQIIILLELKLAVLINIQVEYF